MRGREEPIRRGVAAIVMVVLVLLMDLVIMGMVLHGARDHDLTVRRVETVRAFYAAEGGINMGIRELMNGSDEDGDGGIGSISDDGEGATDPALGAATVRVSRSIEAGGTRLTSEGRDGASRRRLEATLVGSSGSGGAPGLWASYFDDGGWPSQLAHIEWDMSPDETGVVSQLNWPRTSDSTPFWIGGPNMNYGAEFTGSIEIGEGGSWRFYTESDDGSKLWIDGVEVVNNDGCHSMRERSGRVSLTEGAHEFMVRFFERSGNHGLIVSWRGPGVKTKTVIPASAFTH